MNLHRWLLVVLLLQASVTFADDDCTVDPPKPVLNETAVVAGTHRFQLNKSARQATERATLKPDIAVEIEMGGCEHWGETYRFPVLPRKAVGCATWLKEAAGRMKTVAKAAVLPGPILDYANVLRKRVQMKKPYSCSEPLPITPDSPEYGNISVALSGTGKDLHLDVHVQINP